MFDFSQSYKGCARLRKMLSCLSKQRPLSSDAAPRRLAITHQPHRSAGLSRPVRPFLVALHSVTQTRRLADSKAVTPSLGTFADSALALHGNSGAIIINKQQQ